MIFRNIKLLKLNIINLRNALSELNYCSKVPKSPYIGIDFSRLPAETKIDKAAIEQLEKVSLVEFGNEKGIQIVEEAIRFADQIRLIDTEGVEPLYSVLEKRTLPLREDVVTDGNCKNDVLRNSKFLEEDYFVAPPGNIPLETREYDLNQLKSVKKS